MANLKRKKEAQRLLQKFITSGPDSAGEYGARCPIHDDHRSSASFNFGLGVWNCQGCDASGKILDLVYQLQQSGDVEATIVDLDQERTERKGTYAAELSLDEIEKRHEQLLRSDAQMDWLLEHKGLKGDTIRQFKLGYSEKKGFVVPVFDINNKLLNFRYYAPDDPSKKWSSVKGHGGAALFPIAQLQDSEEILICEGELDTLLAIQHGYAAVGGTGGAGHWPGEWAGHFEGKNVFICYDCDEAGVNGAAKVQASVGTVAASVTILTLPYEITPKGGKDLTDYLLENSAEDFDMLKIQANPTPASELGDGHNNTDLGNSERFVKRFGETIKYIPVWNTWLMWTGRRWKPDELNNVNNLAIQTIRHIREEALEMGDKKKQEGLIGHAIKSEAIGKLKAMVLLSESHEDLALTADVFDQDPWLLNCQNGTVDLKTGKIRPHDPQDLITQIIPVGLDPTAGCARWVRFVEEVLPTLDDQEFLKRAVGYSLTGVTDERVLIILYGHGSNGKSVLLEVIRALLGDYGKTADSELLMHKKESSPGGASGYMARLRGARFVTTSETEENQKLDENAIKKLVGGDTITARHLYQQEFEFEPTHKLWMATNHKPKVIGVGHGVWRRIRLLPFEQVFPLDPDLVTELKSELPGILGWALEGCLEWQQEKSLGESENVIRATKEYRTEEDLLGGFITEYCQTNPDFSVLFSDLYLMYDVWARDQNIRSPWSKSVFGKKINERSFKSETRGKSKEVYSTGIQLKKQYRGG